MNKKSIEIMQGKAVSAGLSNVTCVAGLIEEYHGKYDVAVALHACGNATDMAIESALLSKAAFIMCPCCVGKLKFSLAGGSSKSTVPVPDQARVLPHITHPRSKWLEQALPATKANFAMIARAADVSHAPAAEKKPGGTTTEGDALGSGARAAAETPESSLLGKDEALRRLSKLHVELDRALASEERGYFTALFKLIQPGLSAKNDLVVGAPVATALASVVSRVWDSCAVPC